MSSADPRSNVPIHVNVYDVSDLNTYLYWLGLGIFHSAIEVYGVEYAFGAHDYSSSGVFAVEPRSCPGFIFRKSIVVGTTDKDPIQFQTFIEQVSVDYPGNSYHLIAKNCNHFTDDVLMKLVKRPAPGWINRLARIAAFCSCLLPESLQISSVRHDPEDQNDGYAVELQMNKGHCTMRIDLFCGLPTEIYCPIFQTISMTRRQSNDQLRTFDKQSDTTVPKKNMGLLDAVWKRNKNHPFASSDFWTERASTSKEVLNASFLSSSTWQKDVAWP